MSDHEIMSMAVNIKLSTLFQQSPAATSPLNKSKGKQRAVQAEEAKSSSDLGSDTATSRVPVASNLSPPRQSEVSLKLFENLLY